MKTITVEYPIVEKIERLTYRITGLGARYIEKPVNQEQNITVTIERKLTPEELCKELTGMTPSEYQSRYKRAWNE